MHTTHPHTQYHAAIRFIESIGNLSPINPLNATKSPELFLERMLDFLDRLGNPHTGFKYIHVTGTAGKGSVATMAANLLPTNGHRTGLFTSPFVTTTIEKFSVDGQLISPDDFVKIVESITPILDKMHTQSAYGVPSYFEICLAVAFLFFKQMGCEWVVLEVGIGGMFDATNVIPSPKIAVITRIGYDHTQKLGRTLTKITRDKTGIIKPGCKVVCGEARSHLREIIKTRCRITKTSVRFISAPTTELNAALVNAIAEELDLNDAIKFSRQLPARFETVQHSPRVIIDSAHNDIKMAYTATQLRASSYNKLHVVLSVSADKDCQAVLKHCVPMADALYVTRYLVNHRRPLPPTDLAKMCSFYSGANTVIQTYINPHQALDEALKKAGPDDLILVTGSFFLAGELRTRWFSEDWILTHKRTF